MKIKYFILSLLLLGTLGLTESFAQVLLHSEGFETDGEGSRYTSNTFDECAGAGTPDYFIRTNLNPVTPPGCASGFGTTLTGLQGSFFWAGEDIRLSVAGPSRPEGFIQSQSFSILNHNSLTISLYLATSNNSGARWETDDSLNVQVSIDGGPFRTVGRFMGKAAGSNLGIDGNLDGVYTAADPATNCDVANFTQYTFNIPGTGTNMRFKLEFDMYGGTEEIAVDQIEVRGVFAPPSTGDINLVGNAQNILNGDITPSATDHTDFGSVLACTGTISRTFTIQNTASPSLTLTGAPFVQISGANAADFTVTTQPSSATIAGLASTTFTVSFDPSAVGTRNATISIASDDPDENPYTFAISGVGLNDNSAPTVVCPATQTYFLNASCQGTLPDYTGLVTSSDNCGVTSITQSPAAGAIVSGSVTISMVARDASLNAATCTFTANSSDTIRPIASCQNLTVFLNGSGNAFITASMVNNNSTDNCAIGGFSVSPALFNCANIGSNSATLTVTDNSGNTSSCTSIVTVNDSIAPSITCPANISSATSTSTCDAIVSYTAPVGTDNCASPVTSQTAGFPSGGTFPLGTTTNTFVVTDGGGNTDSCSFTVTIFDNVAPTITCPASFGISTSASTCDAIVNYTAPVGTDNCSGATTVQFAGLPSGATFPLGSTTNTYVVTDGAGNGDTCSFFITVLDSVLPTITCPANITVFTGSGSCNAVANYTAPVGTDNCSGATTTQTGGLASGSVFPLGVTTNAFRVTDGSGNQASCSFTITVSDTIAPTITCPANIVTTTSPISCDTVVTFTSPTGSDNCGIASTVQTSGLASGALFPLGLTTNTFVVTDSAGNTSSCSFTVTVDDVTPPVLVCSSNISVSTSTSTCDAIVNFPPPSATDNCSLAGGSQLSGLGSGVSYPLGVTTNSFAVVDSSGNADTCTFTVTVIDSVAPVLVCPANISVSTSASSCDAVVVYNPPSASDNCAIAGGSLTSGLGSGSIFPLGTTTNSFAIVDSAGNTAACSFTVTVIDSIVPVINCPSNISIFVSNSACSEVVLYPTPSGVDNCNGVTTTQTSGLANGALFPVGVTTNTFVTVDSVGNTDSCSFTVSLVDTIQPTIACPGNIVDAVAPGSCAQVITYTSPTESDNCGSPTTVLTTGFASGSSFPVGVTTNTYVTTDASGNAATCSFTVTISDTISPTITCPSNITSTTTTTTCDRVLTYATPVGVDNCSGSVTTQTAGLASGSAFPLGITTNTFVVTDGVGNTSTCTFTVTVADAENPNISCPSNITAYASASNCSAVVTFTAPVGTDNCSGATTVQTTGLASGSTFPVGFTTNNYVVTDGAGLTAGCSFLITVLDTIAPAISCPSNITVSTSASACNAVVNYTTPVGTDNCSGATTTRTAGLASGSAFSLGTTTNTFRVTDGSGTIRSCSFTVTVVDSVAPMLVCPANIVVSSDSGTCNAVVNFTAPTASDNCSQFALSQSGGLPNGSVFPLGTTTNSYFAIDNNSNSSTCSFTITVEDNESPVVNCIAVNTYLSATGTASIVPQDVVLNSSDNCSVSGTNLSSTTFSCQDLGLQLVTVTVSDASGNTGTCTANVTVIDSLAPTAVCVDDTITLGVGGVVTLLAANVDGGSSDNCGAPNLSVSPSTFNGSNLGSNVVTLTVTDASGNADSCMANVFVADSLGTNIAKPKLGISFTAAPNPVSNLLKVTLVCEDCFIGDELVLQLWNTLGQKVQSYRLESISNSQSIELDMSALPAGNYVISLRHNDQVLTRKVLKQ